MSDEDKERQVFCERFFMTQMILDGVEFLPRVVESDLYRECLRVVEKNPGVRDVRQIMRHQDYLWLGEPNER